MPMPTHDGEPPTSLPRKRQTLARVLKEARLAFSERGLAGARIDDIARAAGVTKQLVYHYFSSKEDLFSSVLDESVQDVLADLLALELDHLPPPQAMRVLLEHSFDRYRAHPALSALAQESLRQHELQTGHINRFTKLAPILIRLMEGILRRGEASGEFVTGVDARLFCAASGLLTTGGFTSRYIVSTLAGFDTTTPEGSSAWRRYSVDFVMATVLTCNHPNQPCLPTEPTTFRNARTSAP
ncbi:MAG: TetR/AcrR family transcriptional regulator [Polaromonas sp.]|nr:TetR/AcrR family transcriptional regulator [Polaromonas sp.]